VIRPDEPRQGDGLAVRKDLETVAGARGVARNSIFPGESRRAGQHSPVPPLADVVARHPHEWKPALGLRQRAHPAPRGLAHRPETHGHSKEKGGLHLTTVGGREPGRQRRGGDFNFKRAFFARRETARAADLPRNPPSKSAASRGRRRPVAVGTMQPRA
jgi:hypothetical protein